MPGLCGEAAGRGLALAGLRGGSEEEDEGCPPGLVPGKMPPFHPGL